MKIAFIAPKSLAKHTIAGDFHFIIPQNVSDFYKDSRNFKMLDNGAYEGRAIRVDRLLELAYLLNVDEVVVPDVIKDARATVQNVRRYAKVLSRDFRVAVVPQGASVQEFIECFRKVTRMRYIDTICFPKWLGPLVRPAVVKSLKLPRKFDYHLLGLDNPVELLLHDGRIRSVDTSMPFTYAYHRKTIDLWSKEELPRVPMDVTFDGEQLKLLDENCKLLKDWAGK